VKKFKYKAKDKEGKGVGGIVEAASEKQAALTLRERGLVVISLTASRRDLIKVKSVTKLIHRVGLSEVATFTRQLSTMIIAGLTVADGLRILKEESSPVFSEIIDDILRSVEGGSSLGDALEKHPKVFSEVYVALVRAGEAAGVLDEVLTRLAENLEKDREFRAKIKGAMIYPAVIVVGMIGVGTIMILFVIPNLLKLYEEFEAELPVATKLLMAISVLITKFWWVVLIGIGAIGYYFRSFYKTPLGRRKVDQIKLRLPVVGNLIKMIILTEMTRTLGLLVGTGISIVEGLKIVSRALGNAIYEEELKVAADRVEKGLPLAGTLAEYEDFPPVVSSMVAVGEETGKLDEVLTKLSAYFESESEHLVKGLTSLIEPLIMVVLGIGVGFLIIAVIMPIYNLTSQF
jgi:type IV pilus assembly protein PilC